MGYRGPPGRSSCLGCNPAILLSLREIMSRPSTNKNVCTDLHTGGPGHVLTSSVLVVFALRRPGCTVRSWCGALRGIDLLRSHTPIVLACWLQFWKTRAVNPRAGLVRHRPGPTGCSVGVVRSSNPTRTSGNGAGGSRTVALLRRTGDRLAGQWSPSERSSQVHRVRAAACPEGMGPPGTAACWRSTPGRARKKCAPPSGSSAKRWAVLTEAGPAR